MNYTETIDYLYSQVPMYQLQGISAYKADLSTPIALDKLLESPHTHYDSIHIAGTNGKGSCANMLAAILQASGFRVGLYTSPHLVDFRERIRVNGQMVPQDFVASFVSTYKTNFDTLKPSFFELTVALALDYFRHEHIDVAIIEVGLGGRLDATNIITPIQSIITSLGLDHTNLLGDNLGDIAKEKAGIIKPSVPVTLGPSIAKEALTPIYQRAKELNAPLCLSHDIELVKEKQELSFEGISFVPSLRSSYQLDNTKTVLRSLSCLPDSYQRRIQESGAIAKGLSKVAHYTGFAGRWQQIQTSPLAICDIAHNYDAIEVLLSEVSELPHRRLHFILGFSKDKRINDMLSLLSRKREAQFYFCGSTNERVMHEEDLMILAQDASIKGEKFQNVSLAYTHAKGTAHQDDIIIVAGSAFIVADLLSVVK